ncbi:Nup53/35/40-type RNA recognition motif-domain-containing protein [Limtongia smithiae]|uniref:Nup53/35/40-type RNA recognition motif-domain-containing protein n=1 Tax=Limtongia smithiae TaxID=1125753 RepID=UPI0034CF7507
MFGAAQSQPSTISSTFSFGATGQGATPQAQVAPNTMPTGTSTAGIVPSQSFQFGMANQASTQSPVPSFGQSTQSSSMLSTAAGQKRPNSSGSVELGQSQPFQSQSGAFPSFGGTFGAQQPQQPQQSQPPAPGLYMPNRALLHSKSAFDLGSSFQQQPSDFAPHFPMQQQQQLQQSQLQSTADYLVTSSPRRQPPPAPFWATAEQNRNIVPSHLTHMRSKNMGSPSGQSYYSPDRATPSFPGSPNINGMSPQFPTPSRTPGSLSQSRSGKFNGPSFGTPKPRHARSNLATSSASAANQTGNGSGEDELPPISSIYDSGAASPFAFQMPIVAASAGLATPAGTGMSSTDYISVEDSSQGPASPTSTSSLQPTSVIVFGFPPEMTHVVIDHFRKFGTIIEHVSSSSDASSESDITPLAVETGHNWLKITYTSPLSANRAKQENGKPLGINDYIVGCVAYTGRMPEAETPFGSPAPVSSSTLPTTTGGGRIRRGLRGVGPNLNIHALLEGTEESPSSATPGHSSTYASTVSSKRRGGASELEHLFTPRAQQPAPAASSPRQQSLYTPPVSQQEYMSPSRANSTGLPRTTSVPAGLANGPASNSKPATHGSTASSGRRIDLRGPEGIFKEKERRGGLTGSATLRGIASVFMGGEEAAQQRLQHTGGRVGGVKREADGAPTGTAAKRQQGGDGWFGWSARKAQEFIFGWDDL